MIKKIECYVPVCDVCGKNVDNSADYISHFCTEREAQDYAVESDEYGGGGGKMVDGKLACMNCWAFEDDGEIVMREAQ